MGTLCSLQEQHQTYRSMGFALNMQRGQPVMRMSNSPTIS